MEKAIFRILCLGFLLTSTLAFSQTGYTFSGHVQYQNGFPLSGVTVTLYTLEGQEVTTDISDNDGYYQFENVLPGTYSISCYTEQAPGGIGLDDAYMIEQYLAGNITFTDIQALAADVNGNGIINNGDRMAIINHINHGIPFLGDDWVFVSEPIVVPSTNRDGDIRIGSSSGDVNGSLQPDPKNDNFIIESPVVNLAQENSEYIEFNFTSNNTIECSGMQLEFRIPEGLSVVSIDSPIEQVSYCVTGNMLRITALDSYNGLQIAEGTTLVNIITMQNRPGSEHNFSIEFTQNSHFIDMLGKFITGLKFTMPEILIEEQKSFSHRAYPNPFLSSLTIEYQLPEEGRVTISLFDQYGRLITEVEDGYKAAGSSVARIDGNELVPGIYHYTITYSGITRQVDNGIIIKSN